MNLDRTIDPDGVSCLSMPRRWQHSPTTDVLHARSQSDDEASQLEDWGDEQDVAVVPADDFSDSRMRATRSVGEEDDISSWGSTCPSAIRLYLREISRVTLLTAEQEITLAQRIESGDEDAANALAQANLRLVVKVARGYQNRGLALEDLIAEGNMGLLQAVQKYDWRRGFRFSTYASWWIRQAVVRALADKGRVIRLPVHLGDELAKRNAAANRLAQESGTVAASSVAMQTVGALQARTWAAERAAQPVISLDRAVSQNGDTSIGELVGDPTSVMPDHEVERRVVADEIRRVMRDELTSREHLVLTLRYGLDNGAPETLAAVGRKLGVTRERTRQIETMALLKLRKPIARAHL